MASRRFAGLVITDAVSETAVARVVRSVVADPTKWFVEHADLYPQQTLIVALEANEQSEMVRMIAEVRTALADQLGLLAVPTEEELDVVLGTGWQ